MINGKKITVVLPAYNAEKTLEQTFSEIPFDIVDDVILVDDHSRDNTVDVAKSLGIRYIIEHVQNKGYGGNQKSCYDKALEINSDIVVMLHPDYQYTPKLIHSMCYLIANDVYQVVLGSRILGKGALKGGMPLYKYISNRFLTLAQNILMKQKLSEYHTGYRAFSREVLLAIKYKLNSDDFIFDNQMLAQICYAGYEIAEITCPTKYFEEASSINLKRSIKYGLGVLGVSFRYRMQKWGIAEMAGVGKTVVFDLEKGKETIRLDTLRKILHVLNIKVELTSQLMDKLINTNENS
jgi:glycosyltransferase involved in cell wall biosynthesis